MNQLPVIALILMLAAAACSRDARLDTAAALMYPAPDSAMAVLGSIDPAGLRSDALRARYALLYSQAQNKNHIFPISDSLINIAVAYYDHHGHDSLRMLSHFYRAVIYNRIESYHMALRDGLIAKDLADALGQPYWTARASEEIADAYYNSYNMATASLYHDIAIENYNKTGYVINAQYVVLDKINSLTQRSMYQQSLTLLDSMSNIIDPADLNLRDYLEESYIRPCYYSNFFDSALIHGNRARMYAKALGQEMFDYNDMADIHIKLGNLDSAAYYIAKAEKCSHADTILIKYRYYKALGDINKSFSYLERQHKITNNRLRTYISDNISLEENDFVHRQSETVIQEKQHKIAFIILISTIIILAVVSLLIYVKLVNRLKHQRIERRLSEASLVLQELTQTNRKLSSQLAQANGIALRGENTDLKKEALKELFNRQFVSISNLCDKYYSCKLKPGEVTSLYRQLEYQIEKIISEESINNMQEIINHYSDGKLEELSQHISFTKDEKVFLTLLLAGFSVRSICSLLKFENSTYYTKRRRLKDKIIQGNSPLVDYFIPYLSKRNT